MSHGWCWGNRFASSSEKTFFHLWYWGGTIWSHGFSSFGSALTAIWVEVEVRFNFSSLILVTWISSPGVAIFCAHLTHALQTLTTSLSILRPSVLITTGCMSASRTASFQFIFGWNAANQGNPRTILSSPKSVMRNRMSSVLFPHRIWRSTKSLMVPPLFRVASMFQMALGRGRGSFPIFILFRSLSLMKLSVAPESTRTCLSAFECALCKRVGIRIDLYLQVNTLLTPNTCAQAVGVACFKNPRQGLPYPAPLLPPF